MTVILHNLLILFLFSFLKAEEISFSDDFIFGVANAAYQSEGAWNESGRGLSIWDNFTHRYPSPIKDGSNGDIACNSYHKYEEDIALAAATGSDFYRFSISWSRILPTGYTSEINQKGIDFYKKFVQEIINKGLKPLVTIYHWDLPQKMFEDGVDWTNSSIVPVFVNYARIVIKNFPEVYRWISINEPRLICRFGYGNSRMAPGLKSSGLLEYQCNYNVLKAHAAVYHMYKEEFPQYTAKMSIVVDTQWFEPKTNLTKDIEATERQKQFETGMYFHPIVLGDWPEVVKDRINGRSTRQNLSESRLPAFTSEEIEYINGTFDFLAINHYHVNLVADDEEADNDVISYDSDVRVIDTIDSGWDIESNGWAYVPVAIRRALNWLREQYGDQEIFISEIGITEDGSSIDDVMRVHFYQNFFCNILAAIKKDGIKVSGITAWSLMDNFGWNGGYTTKYGLYSVNFSDPDLPRTAKTSLQFWQNLTSTKILNCNNYENDF